MRALCAGALLAGWIAITDPAGAVDDDGVFELEGNLVDDEVAGDDWVGLYEDDEGLAGGSTAFTGILNDRVDDETYYNGGGSKDHIDIPSWGSNGNSAPPKDEITNAYAASYNVGGDHVIYFGVDRGATNGDAQMGFWFFQNSVEVDGNGFSGSHVARDLGGAGTEDDVRGDLLVLSDFTKGGKVGSVKVYEWVGDGSGSHGNLHQILSQSSATGDSPECGAANASDPDNVCAIENGVPVDVPDDGWEYNGDTFAKGAFLEGGINVSALFPGTNACFASFQAETRSSQETTATLKDFVNGEFEPCIPSTTLSAGTADPAVVHNGESSSVIFTETNDGKVPLEDPEVECIVDQGLTGVVTPVVADGEDTEDPPHDPPHNTGDTNHDGILDPLEAWQFTCTIANATPGLVTVTGIGHGIDPSTGNDVTWCPDSDDPPDGPDEPLPADTLCDQHERATATFSVINPDTALVATFSATVTYTFTETNHGDGPLTRSAAINFVESETTGCTLAETYATGTNRNVGDDPNVGTVGELDPGESWVFTCERTFTDEGTYVTAATGHGLDSADDQKDITWCPLVEPEPGEPPVPTPGPGERCDQDERDQVTVTISSP